MIMIQYLKIFLCILFTFIILDFIWFVLIAKSLYQTQIGSLMRVSNGHFSPNWYAALLVYVLFALGILIFVLSKAQKSPWEACYYGAIFGLVIYGIYDLTNLALLANWPTVITIIDIIWGIIVCSIIALSAFYYRLYFIG